MPRPPASTVSKLTHLNPQQEMLANLVANGSSAREAASLAGFAPNYSSILCAKPEVRNRIAEIQELQDAERDELSGIVTRSWIEAQLVIIVQSAMAGTPAHVSPRTETAPAKVLRGEIPPDHDLARRCLMDLARLKGMIVDKRESKSLTGAIPAGAMKAHLAQYLDALEPGARTAIERRMAALEARKGKPALGRPPKVLESAPAHGST